MRQERLERLLAAAEVAEQGVQPFAELTPEREAAIRLVCFSATGVIREVRRLEALVEAAFREGRDEDAPDHPSVDAAWMASRCRRELTPEEAHTTPAVAAFLRSLQGEPGTLSRLPSAPDTQHPTYAERVRSVRFWCDAAGWHGYLVFPDGNAVRGDYGPAEARIESERWADQLVAIEQAFQAAQGA